MLLYVHAVVKKLNKRCSNGTILSALNHGTIGDRKEESQGSWEISSLTHFFFYLLNNAATDILLKSKIAVNRK